MTGTIELFASFFKRRSHRPGNLIKHNVTQLGIEQRPELKHHLWGRERELRERELGERENWGVDRENVCDQLTQKLTRQVGPESEWGPGLNCQ